jgi:hypothetical protein
MADIAMGAPAKAENGAPRPPRLLICETFVDGAEDVSNQLRESVASMAQRLTPTN